MTLIMPVRSALFAALVILAFLAISGYRVLGSGAEDESNKPYAEAVIPPPAAGSPCRVTRLSSPSPRALSRSPCGCVSKR